jgi:hypothetical protein
VSANIFAQNLGAENLFANTSLKVLNNCTVYGNSAVKKDLYTYNRIIMGNIEGSGNVLTYIQNDNSGNLTINQAKVTNLTQGLATVYTEGSIGFNTATPVAAFDLVNAMPNTLNVQSTNDLNYNVIARNATGAGIMTMTDSSSCSVRFFAETPMDNDNLADTLPDSYIQYDNGGSLFISVKNNTFVQSGLTVSLRDEFLPVMGETLTVYDTSAGIYMYDTYNEDTALMGNGMTVVSADASSATFINLITPDTNGFAFGGGAYPYDQTRTFGTVVYIDGSDNYIPAINIVSGTDFLKYKTTTGINKNFPTTEDRVLDINGPTFIHNAETTLTTNVPFEITQYAMNPAFPDYAIAVGYPYTLAGEPDTLVYDSFGNLVSKNYQQQVYITFDRGITWSVANFNNTDLGVALNPIQGVAIYDNSMVIVSAEYGFAFHSADGGLTWYGIAGIPSTFMSNSAFICKMDFPPVYRVILSSSVNAYWFDLPYSAYSLADEINTEFLPSGTFSFDISVNLCKGYQNNVYFLGDSTIEVYNITGGGLDEATFTYKRTTSSGNTYTDISVFSDSVAIAVGNALITYTMNGGANWTELAYRDTNPTVNTFLKDITLNSVYAYSTTNALCVGYNTLTNEPVFFHSSGGYSTWIPIPLQLFVDSGAPRDFTSSSNLYNISLTHNNHIQLFNIVSPYDPINNSVGVSSIFNCFLPSVFTPETNTVLEITGNMNLNGTIFIDNMDFKLQLMNLYSRVSAIETMLGI